MSAKILIVDDDPITLSWLQAILEREGYAVRAASHGELALQQIAQDPPDLVVLDLILPDIDGLEVLRRLRQDPARRDLRVVILSVRGRAEDIVAGLRTGADDYVPKRPGADIELISKIRVLLATPREISGMAGGGGGKIIAFCSAKGGTGTTSVCVNAAYAMTQLVKHADVLLVDMVFPVGTLGSSIGYESSRTIAQLSRQAGTKMDRAIVEKYVSPLQRWGFRVLLGARDPQEATSLEVSQIVPLFNVLRTMHDYILVDFGRTLSRISLPVIQTADCIVLIVTPDISAVKLSRLTLEYFESLGISREQLIVITNRTVGRVWTSKDEIEQQLRLPSAATIPYETEHFTLAINSGVPFMARFPEHSASLMFNELARMIMDRLK